MIEGPIKRNPNLIPLSREHHATLLFCWKLKTGLKREVGVSRVATYALWFHQQHLKPHFKSEEEILFTDTTDLLVKRALQEHKQIGWLVEEIEKCETDPTSIIQKLAALVYNHTRYEERELFPYLEQTLHTKDLQRIGKALDLAEHTAEENYDDPFWNIEKKIQLR